MKTFEIVTKKWRSTRPQEFSTNDDLDNYGPFSEHLSGYPSSDEEQELATPFEIHEDSSSSLDEELEGFDSPFKSIIGQSKHIISNDHTTVENVEKDPILVILRHKMTKVRNSVWFEIQKLSSEDLYVGVIKLNKQKSFDMVWSYCLPSGKTRWIGGAGHTTLAEYMKKWETKYKKGSILEMVVDKGEMHFILNARPLGLAFKDDRMQEKNIFAYVRLGFMDSIKIL